MGLGTRGPHASHYSPFCRSPGSPAKDLLIPKEALLLGGEQPSRTHRPLFADLLVPPPTHPTAAEGAWLGKWFCATRGAPGMLIHSSQELPIKYAELGCGLRLSL